MNYKLVRYDPRYSDQVCELEKEIWSPDLSVNRSYLQWKYFDNRFTDTPAFYLALDKERVIAARGIYETWWRFGNNSESFTALCAGDLVIQREYRNKGVYTELMKFIRNDLYDLGHQFLLSFSAGPANLINSLAIGWKSIGRIKVMRKELNQSAQLMKFMSSNTMDKVLRLIKTTSLKSLPEYGIDCLEEVKIHKDAPPQIRLEKKPLVSEMSSLIKKLNPANKLIMARDEKFFNWRYRNPLSAYFFLYWHDDGLKGYAVAQTSRYKRNMNFNILELEALSPQIKVNLLKALRSLRGIRSISVWSSMIDDDCRKYLSSAGFSESQSKGSVADFVPTILIWPTEQSNDTLEYQGVDLTDVKNWDLKMFYSDAL